MGSSDSGLRKLVTGDYPVLETAFLDEVTRLRSEDKLNPLIILVSSHLVGLHLQRSLAGRGTPHINLRFLTLEDLAAKVAAPALVAQGMTRVLPLGPELIIRTSVNELASSGRNFYFGRIANRPGFHEALLSSIADLKNAGLSPRDLKAAVGRPKVTGKVNQAKILDLVKIWGAYEAKLAELAWFDDHDMMRESASLIPRCMLVREASAILVYGFYDFNALEKQLLQACFESKNTTCLMPYEPRPAFKYAEAAIAWLKANGFEEDSDRKDRSSRSVPAETRASAIEHLCRHLFDSGQAIKNPEDAITIISAPGELREVRETIREIVSHSQEESIPLHEVGILLRNPESYAGLFRETLERLGFKPYIPEGFPLSATRSGRSLLLLLDVLKHDFARQAVMEFATFAKLRSNVSDTGRRDSEATALWNVISMEAGIVGGADEWQVRLKRFSEDLRREPDEIERPGTRPSELKVEAARTLNKFMKKLIAYLTAVRSGRTWTAKALNLIDAFSSLLEADEHTEDIKAVLHNLSELDQLGTPPSFDEFHNFAEAALSTSAGPIGKFQRNGPAVLNLMASRGIPFRVVVLPGMVEKSFPPVVRQDAILLDDERAALNHALSRTDREPLPLKARQRLEEEQLLFRLTVGAAQHKIVMAYPRIEIATARERLPSSLLLATMKALSETHVDFHALERFKGLKRIPLARIAVSAPRQALDRLEYDLAKGLEEIAAGKPEYLLLLRRANSSFRRALKLEADRWGKNTFTSYDGLLSKKEARKQLKANHSIRRKAVSPTRLEVYATCPYRYLLGSIMRIEPVVEPERVERISPLNRGELIHLILWEFLTDLKNVRGSPVTVQPEDAELLHKIATRRFDEFENRGLTGYPALWALEKQSVLEYLDEFIEEEIGQTEFLPAYFEVRYGMKPYDKWESEISTAEPVLLKLRDLEFSVTGRIDRIDISPDQKRACVIDYKSGGAYANANDLDGGRSLQLPIYLVAADHVLSKLHEGIRTDRAEYYHISLGGTKRHIRFDRGALESKQDELSTILCTIADSLESGYLFARPGDHCRYCDFVTVCGSSRHVIFDLKCKDARVQNLLNLEHLEDAGRE